MAPMTRSVKIDRISLIRARFQFDRSNDTQTLVSCRERCKKHTRHLTLDQETRFLGKSVARPAPNAAAKSFNTRFAAPV
jgi:hypothetical protein